MKLYSRFLEFIIKNYRNFIFVTVFYSLWLIFKYASTFNPELHSFSGRMIGEATLQSYDISKRIKAFYQAGALFFLSIVIFSIIAWRVSSFIKEFFKAAEIRIINYTSLAGIILYFFTLWGTSINTSLELIFCIHKIVITIYVFKKLILKNINNTHHIGISFYAIALVLGVSVFFVWNETEALFHFLPKADIFTILYLFVVLVSILVLQLINRRPLSDVKNYTNKIAYLVIPLACIPLLSFFKDEIYLILNRHGVYYFRPVMIYITGLVILSILILWRYYKIKNNTRSVLLKNTDQLVATRYFPLLVLSIATYLFYNPFIQASTEMFEDGNRFLPLMEFQKFGVIPILEKFNAHQLVELFWGAIYAFFNGLHGREMPIYDFMDMVIWFVLTYYFIYKLSHNAYVALFVTLFFPLTGELIHARHSIAFLAIFMLHLLINEKASVKNYLLLFICSAFLTLWRMDIGYASTIAITATLFIYWLNEKRFVFDRKLVVKSIFIFSASWFLLLGAISFWRGFNIFHKLLNGFNYLASAQSYGFINLGQETTSVFKMQYFVFPLLLIFGFCALLLFFKRYTISRSQRFVYTSLIFLTIYYFVNFQRGIVRHSFREGSDGWLSPSLFLIMSAGVYLFMHKKSQAIKFILFIVVSTFLIMNYKYPAVNAPQNIFSQATAKAKNFSEIETNKNIERCINDMHYEDQKFGNFKNLITSRLNEKQTFIDFSNSPMLYYLTGKISPSYFYQNPLTIHNDYLQNNFISELKNYDAPLLVFSNFPANYWDNVNEVPNGIRHYRMAEYFYNNYQPFIITDGLCIWKKNDFTLENKTKNIFSYNTDTLKNRSEIDGEVNLKANKKYYFAIRYKDFTKPSSIKIINSSSTKTISSVWGDEKLHLNYFILDSTQEGNLKFSVNNSNSPVESFTILESDYIPDFYSVQAKRFDLKQLPYIWGTYDKTVHQEKLIADLLSKTQSLPTNTFQYFNFSTGIDKSTGNTILISLECYNEAPVEMGLLYGSSKSGYKGSFSFSVPPGKGTREFAIRISSQYNWYAPDADYIALICKNTDSIKLNTIKLLKGS